MGGGTGDPALRERLIEQEITASSTEAVGEDPLAGRR
jgi:hypothetical protein